MAGIVYSKMSGKNDALYGKFEHPIKALIENESNAWEKRKTILDVLYNVEKSNRYSETVMAQSDFDTFMATGEGQRGENDSTELTYKKTIEHISFKKNFTITREMADDAKLGMGAEMRTKPTRFVRAYYKTKIKIAEWALVNGTKERGVFNNAKVDLTTGDEHPLFYGAHPYAKKEMKGKTQSNYFYGANMLDSVENFETFLNLASNKLRNFKDENGEVMEYTANIVVIPGNRPRLEAIAKKVIGTERTVGTGNNDINIQYGNWTLVVLTGWTSDDDRCIVMSSEANENLMGNMFYNRVPLDVASEVDINTRNQIWNGYCRFGVGFTTWKHALMMVGSETKPTGSTATDINA
jgi:hypothetical protein